MDEGGPRSALERTGEQSDRERGVTRALRLEAQQAPR